MRNKNDLCGLALGCAMALLGGAGAHAQVNPEGGDVGGTAQGGARIGGGAHAQANWQPPAGGQPAAGYVAPVQDPNAGYVPAGAPMTGDDHTAQVGHFGIGFFGVQTLPVMRCDGPGCMAPDVAGNLAAPTIGMRYWLSDKLGVEGGLGLNVTSASSGAFDTSLVGFALHAGLPLAFAHTGHFVFELIPQLDFGVTSGSYEAKAPSAAKANVSGFLIDLGAKAGAEIHFGFIGIPQLSLQGTLGLMIRHESRSYEIPATMVTPAIKGDSSATSFSTGVDGAPWSIFTGALTAIYYF